MGFFKEFKEDLSQAVTELVTEPELESNDDMQISDDDIMVNTLDDTEIDEIATSLEIQAEAEAEKSTAELVAKMNKTIENDRAEESAGAYKDMVDNLNEDLTFEDMEEIVDETATITPGLKIKGDLTSKGSIDIAGEVEGDVQCNGKLTVSGEIIGNAKANEIFVNDAKVNGSLEANGAIKIAQGTVIVGNIIATSAVIAGAVKGDIDIKGPVIVDASAIIVGDIKSKTVQINNGATIDGRCSQCYADVNTASIFEF